jgi:hypothetical protein
MNDRDLEMLDAWRHGRLSKDEFDVMQDRLRLDAELRQRCDRWRKWKRG